MYRQFSETGFVRVYSSLIVRAEMSLRYSCEFGSRSYTPPTPEPDGFSYRDADLLMMIAFITFKSSLVPLLEGL